MMEFKTLILIYFPLGKFTYTNGGIYYEHSKEILDHNAPI